MKNSFVYQTFVITPYPGAHKQTLVLEVNPRIVWSQIVMTDYVVDIYLN
jgi:hypothetical protein